MNGQLKMFGLNLYFLIGALLVLGVGAVVLIAAWTGLKIFVWEEQKRSGERAERRRKLRPDGTPLPPASRGLCTACSRAYEQVYHLPGGERLCPTCYAAAQRKEAS
jgi:hypothetical protein